MAVPNHPTLLLCRCSNSVFIIDTSTEKVIIEVKETYHHYLNLKDSVSFSKHNDRLVIQCSEKFAYVDLSTKKVELFQASDHERRPRVGEVLAVYTAKISACGRRIIVHYHHRKESYPFMDSDDNVIKIFYINEDGSLSLQQRLKAFAFNFTRPRFNHDGRFFLLIKDALGMSIYGGMKKHDSQLEIWSVEEQRCIQSIDLDEHILSAEFTPDNRIAVSHRESYVGHYSLKILDFSHHRQLPFKQPAIDSSLFPL